MAVRPPWKKTRVPWELEVSIWDRMANGDTNAQVGIWLDESDHSLDRRTVRLVRQELRDLPEETGQDLPDNIQAYWRELQSSVPAGRGLGRKWPWTLPATRKLTWGIVVMVFLALGITIAVGIGGGEDSQNGTRGTFAFANENCPSLYHRVWGRARAGC